ncbi:MAG: DUF998 domain-containing protein [candidate division KSB1 bacterium]|nr:DUF998 domain-containing protein [candidate division KSB1 bacterium]
MSYSIIAVVIYLIFIGLAHIQTPDSYDWKRYPVGRLSARTYKNYWILMLGNTLFSVIFLTGMTWKFLNGTIDWMEQLPIAFFAFSIFMSSFFRPNPVSSGHYFPDRRDTLHNLFILLAGISFLIGILVHFVSVPDITQKLVHFSFLVVLSIAFLSHGIFTRFSGVVQRVILLISCAWLLFFY